jgi:protein O-mannosyl-transferase
LVVYLGALWNRFAMDDLYVVAFNPLVRSASGLWRAFGGPYWPPNFGGKMYRPLVIASFGLDHLVGGVAWFHAVNILWHAATSVAVAVLARRWLTWQSALVAGLVFAVHPVHVEAVANVVGRGELMAAMFAILAVYAALAHDGLGWSAAALSLGLLSKENAAIAPALIAVGWTLGLGRTQSRRRMGLYVASWAAIGLAYGAVRFAVLQPYARWDALAPVFLGATPLQRRFTAVAALADVARVLVFPRTLRVDYSPNEFTVVASVVDQRFLLGLAALLVWVGLVWWAWRWRREHPLAVFGLAWVGIAFLPVANILFPTGILVAERTLYLPSVGLALALGAWLRAPSRPQWIALSVILAAAGIRSALRVPIWRDDRAVTLSILDDSPASYRGPARTASLLQSAGQPAKALAGYQAAVHIYDRDPSIYVAAADAAFTLGRSALADSLLMRANQLCFRCTGYLETEAIAARSRGDHTAADSLLGWVPRWERERP